MVTVYCTKHKKYKAKREPKDGCIPCNMIWELATMIRGVKRLNLDGMGSKRSGK